MSQQNNKSLEEMIDAVLSHLQVRVQGNLVALALTGSSAAGYANHDSDYDFFAIYDTSLPFHYLDFNVADKNVSVKVEGKDRFELRMHDANHPFAEQGSFVWLPYAPIIGEGYLKSVELRTRNRVLDDFLASLPISKTVAVHPERIAEWSFIAEALYWPSNINRLKAIASTNNNVLETITQKYRALLRERGYKELEDGNFVVRNDEISLRKADSFYKVALFQAKRFFRKKEGLKLSDYLKGVIFVVVQLPERLANMFYTFPVYVDRGDYLEYVGPTLKEFANSRRYFDPLRKLARYSKQNLLTINKTT